jgi:hypothetical protein
VCKNINRCVSKTWQQTDEKDLTVLVEKYSKKRKNEKCEARNSVTEQ